MKFFSDKEIVRELLREGVQLDSSISQQFTLTWPAFFQYLGIESLFENFPLFDQENGLFKIIISILHLEDQKDFLIQCFDQMFAECLTEIQSFPEIHPTYLLNIIQEKKALLEYSEVNKIFSTSLEYYEKALRENPYSMIHGLILYLAWDRVCANFKEVFEYTSPLDIQKGLIVLKECLLESFQHITGRGETAPSFFRLLETLFIYYMRDENLQKHTEQEWAIFCQSFPLLHSREEFIDVNYVDHALTKSSYSQKEDSIVCFTMNSPDKVIAISKLAHCVIEKLKREERLWKYSLQHPEVISLKLHENKIERG